MNNARRWSGAACSICATWKILPVRCIIRQAYLVFVSLDFIIYSAFPRTPLNGIRAERGHQRRTVGCCKRFDFLRPASFLQGAQRMVSACTVGKRREKSVGLMVTCFRATGPHGVGNGRCRRRVVTVNAARSCMRPHRANKHDQRRALT